PSVKSAFLFCLAAALPASAVILWGVSARAQPGAAEAAKAGPPNNLAVVATASTSFVSGHETLDALNDGLGPRNSNDKRRGAYGNWPRTGTQWVQYDWAQPVSIDKMDVYWFDDGQGVRLPKACRLKSWDGSAFVEVAKASGLGVEA